jgi:hypothetical protein
VESRLLGFPCFPYSVISMACFGNAFHKVKITAEARFGSRNHLSEMAHDFKATCRLFALSMLGQGLSEAGQILGRHLNKDTARSVDFGD